ncbi:MAG TPA: nucleotidyltransferase family protein [Castellaniella sp.]|uniref:N-acetylmuramate alpha-1-phosphate uridylyltransferase MurU n=1 Tax=Castellaniella sp. TaxID=1955812 RepID=UPI002EF8A6B8
MRAMILAAGRGERMRPLTDTCPKPLLKVAGKPLIVWHILRLAQAGFHDIVINHAWLGEQILDTLGHGEALGVRLHYSAESPALETAGGIAHALHFFEGHAFLVVNSDIWCDWDPGTAIVAEKGMSETHQAHLVLVDNPVHHPAGDFVLQPDCQVALPVSGQSTLTYAGIGVFHPSLFAALSLSRPAPLAPLLRAAMERHAVTGERHAGAWTDVGTPQRLAELDCALRARPTRDC